MNNQKSGTTGPCSLEDRIRGAVWGQFVGDAFCLGSHWIYDLTELDRRFPGGPQGFEVPADWHYHFGKKSGDLTHYGEGALVLLQSLAVMGAFNAVEFGSRYIALFDSPGYSGYRDHATKETIANFHAFRAAHPKEVFRYQGGADDDQPATVSRLAPLAALYSRHDDYLSVVERATLVFQNNLRAVAYAQGHALILRELLSGAVLSDAARTAAKYMAAKSNEGIEVSKMIHAAVTAASLDVRETAVRFGQSCPLKSSFPSALQCALHHTDDFTGALRANAAAGGDNAGRAAMIGAWLGALHGIDVVPHKWMELLTAEEKISDKLEIIVALVHEVA